jgi:hypothetical protein
MAIDGLSDDPDEIPKSDFARETDTLNSAPARGGQPGRCLDKASDRVQAKDEPGKDELVRAVVELAAENADLYRKNAAQDQQIARLETAIGSEKARHAAWAQEISARDEARDKREAAREAREQTRDKLLEEQADLVAELRAEIAELRQRSSVAGSGVPERRASTTKTFDAEASGQKPRKGGISDEWLGLGAAVTQTVLTAAGDWLGTTVAQDATGIAGGAIGIGAAGIAWVRKHREDKNADRSKG